ncbi:MAG TPA: hypothetical protein PLI95_01345 [Polyangiaceae bacterium]|nr:hypothetical protein [Polyangiaceae bacterium]
MIRWQSSRFAKILSRFAGTLRELRAEVRRRLRVVHRAPGSRLIVPFGSLLTLEPVCCACGAPCSSSRPPARAPRVAFGPLPALEIPTCPACTSNAVAHSRFELVTALGAVVFSSTALIALFVARPWAAWPWAVLCAAAASALALLLRLARRRVPLGTTAWHAAVARWIGRSSEGAVLESPSDSLRAQLVAQGCSARFDVVVERDAFALGLCSAGCSLALAPLLWFHAHPHLRILNLGETPVEVAIDGRVAAELPPVWTEAPNVGARVRVPIGWRSFVTRNKGGEVLDRSRAWLPSDAPALYAPRPASHCLWIEQRAYGATPAPIPSVVRLSTGSPLHVLPLRVDAWFQANPAPATDARLFSGGVRRALRFGPCAVAPSP